MPASTVQRTVTVAIWEYHTPEGRRRRAYFGDVVELTADEVKRGEKGGVFDQPVAGPVDTPFIAKGVLASNFVEALTGIEPLYAEPLGDDGTARLHHDVRPPVVESVQPVDTLAAPAVSVEPSVELPARVANKAVLVEWLVTNGRKHGGTREELAELNKDQLWEYIHAEVE